MIWYFLHIFGNYPLIIVNVSDRAGQKLSVGMGMQLCRVSMPGTKLKLCRKAIISPAELSQPGHEAMRRNAGILMYKYCEDELLVLLVHLGRSVLGEKGPWKLVHPEWGI